MPRTQVTTRPAQAESSRAKQPERDYAGDVTNSHVPQARMPPRKSASTIRVAGDPNMPKARPPTSFDPRPLQRSFSQPVNHSQAALSSNRPTWATAAPSQFQVVHPSSQHPPSQRPSASQLAKLRDSSQPPVARNHFSHFAYFGPADPTQAPIGRRLTIPPAVSRATSSRPLYTAQGALYSTQSNDAEQSGQTQFQLDGPLSLTIDKGRAGPTAPPTDASKGKGKGKKKNKGPKTVDLSVPEEGSWVRGRWIPDEPEPQEPPPTAAIPPLIPVEIAPSQQHLSTGNPSFQSDLSFPHPARGHPDSQLPPGRQPQRQVSSSVSNQYGASQVAPSYTSTPVRPSGNQLIQEPLFLSQDSDSEQDANSRVYGARARVEQDYHDPPNLSASGFPRGSAAARNNMDSRTDAHGTPPHRIPEKTNPSPRKEHTYSRGHPIVYTYRPGSGAHGQPEALDDGVSFNKDLLRKRRQTTVEPSQATREPLRPLSITPDDPFQLAPNPKQQDQYDYQETSGQDGRDDAFGAGYDEEGEEELDEGDYFEDADQVFPPFDNYQADTPSPPPGQRAQTQPEYQEPADELFDTPTGHHTPSYDPRTMLPLTERFVLVPGQRFEAPTTQSQELEGHQHRRKKSKTSRRNREKDKRSPRDHSRRYDDRKRQHRYSRSHSKRKHRHYDEDSRDEEEVTPTGRLRMSRHESAAPRIDKYVENSRKQMSDATHAPRPPLAPRPQSVPQRKPDPKARAALRGARLTNLSPIKSVFGDEKRQVMLDRSQLQKHPVDKHLIGATTKHRQRERLEQLTGRTRSRKKEKENTEPRSAPATFNFQRPSDIADDEELVRATQSTIDQFASQGSVTETRRGGAGPKMRRRKVPQLRFTRRMSPESRPRTPPLQALQEAGPSHTTATDAGQVNHLPSQHTPKPLRPATPLNDIIPPLPRVPIGVGSQVNQTPQRSTDDPKTPTSVMSARDFARAQRDAADQALVDAMLTPADAEKLARELARDAKQGEEAVGEEDQAFRSVQIFDMGPAHPGDIELITLQRLPIRPLEFESTEAAPSKVPKVLTAPAGPSRSLGKIMTREAISDSGQEMRELLKQFKASSSPSKQSSGASGPDGPEGAKGSKHDRSGKRKHTASKALPSGQSRSTQAKLPSFMQKILPHGPRVPTQAEIRSTQVPRKSPEEDFEVKLKEPKQLLISDLAPSSSKKRLGKHLLEDLHGVDTALDDDAVEPKDRAHKRRTASTRLGLSKPATQSTRGRDRSLGTPFGGREFSQSVTRPYKNPTTSDTPRMLQEDRERAFLTPTQRSRAPTQNFEDEYVDLEEEDELIDDDEDGPSAPLVYPLHRTTTPKLQRSLAEAPLKSARSGARLSKSMTSKGFVAPRRVELRPSTTTNNNNKTSGQRQTKPISRSQGRNILTEDSHEIMDNDLIEDDGDENEEDYYDGDFDGIEDFKGLDYALGLAEPSTRSTGLSNRQGHMQGGRYWK